MATTNDQLDVHGRSKRDLMASLATWATSHKNPSIFQRVLKAQLTKRYLSARVINFSVC
jgi:hypothetical protein